MYIATGGKKPRRPRYRKDSCFYGKPKWMELEDIEKEAIEHCEKEIAAILAWSNEMEAKGIIPNPEACRKHGIKVTTTYPVGGAVNVGNKDNYPNLPRRQKKIIRKKVKTDAAAPPPVVPTVGVIEDESTGVSESKSGDVIDETAATDTEDEMEEVYVTDSETDDDDIDNLRPRGGHRRPAVVHVDGTKKEGGGAAPLAIEDGAAGAGTGTSDDAIKTDEETGVDESKGDEDDMVEDAEKELVGHDAEVRDDLVSIMEQISEFDKSIKPENQRSKIMNDKMGKIIKYM
jgi:hypothetical protein